uniref:Uncharacterized protein n=1 Tax=Anguilla anguilla TaxID=7936 RepID=A0A0E9XF55_ANGAN
MLLCYIKTSFFSIYFRPSDQCCCFQSFKPQLLKFSCQHVVYGVWYFKAKQSTASLT